MVKVGWKKVMAGSSMFDTVGFCLTCFVSPWHASRVGLQQSHLPISAFVTRTEWNKWIVMDSVDPSNPAEVSLFKCGLPSHSFPTHGMCSPGRPTLINFSSKWQGCGQKRSCLPAVRVAWCAMGRVSFDILQTYLLCLTATMYFKMCHFVNLSL